MKKRYILFIILFVFSFYAFPQENGNTFEQYIVNRSIDQNGKEMVTIIVPGKPPEKHREPVAVPTRSMVALSQVPAFDWSFGCSPTAASMAAAFYDNNGYPNMYTGPTNWGIMPMNNSSWGTVVINGETRSQCPLSATRNTVDGRTTRGHVDDYWVLYGSSDPDPYITNGWTEHTYSDCMGDYMGTNQSALGSSDASTSFVFYVDGSPFSGTAYGDGCYGMKQFYISRGYSVSSYYSQYIYGWGGNTLGFTFDQYKQEINNGRPVLIQVEGHTMLGYGYDDAGSLVYLHDTWDYSSHTMVWGTSYSGMAQYGVTVVQLSTPPVSIMANFSADILQPAINTTVHLTDLSYGNPTGWNWSISPGTFTYVNGTSSTSQNPQVQFTAEGPYTVSLTVSRSGNQDSHTKTNYISAIDCNNLTLPYNEDFSDLVLPLCWSNVDHIGNNQAWEFYIPGTWPINTTTGSNGVAILDSDHYGNGNSQNADLISPVFDLTLYTSVNLYFEHYFKEWPPSSGTLSYSINGGSSWTPIQVWTAETANATIFSMDVTSLVAGHSNVKFKWNYIGEYAYLWAVDDVSLTGTIAGLWTGNTSSNWSTPTNWSDGVVPGSTTDITIPASASNWPSFTGNLVLGTNCRNITMNGASQLTITGNLTIPVGKEFKITGNGHLKVRGSIYGNTAAEQGIAIE
jgi:PKD repeat protein